MARLVHRACTLCEATCGLTFEVDGERILSVRPDPDDPFSRGFACPKGIAIAQLHDDPDRIRQPVKRNSRGDFEPISWDEALDLAARGLADIKRRYGRNAVAVYWGNPIIHNHGALMLRTGLTRALGTRNTFGAGSQDVSVRSAGSPRRWARCRPRCSPTRSRPRARGRGGRCSPSPGTRSSPCRTGGGSTRRSKGSSSWSRSTST